MITRLLFFKIVFTFSMHLFFFLSFSQDIKKKNAWEFGSLTLHNTPAGTESPTFSLNIYKNKKIELFNTIYTNTGETDTSLTGLYKGLIPDSKFEQLEARLKLLDFNNLTVLDSVNSNKPISTFIISINGKNKRFHSSQYPNELSSLIEYLKNFSTSIELQKFDGIIDFEY